MKGGVQGYWLRVKLVTAALLLVWSVVSFGLTYFARELDFTLLGWPFSYWVAAQGALIVYGLIIAVYAWSVNRLDDRYGVADPPDAEDAHGP